VNIAPFRSKSLPFTLQLTMLSGMSQGHSHDEMMRSLAHDRRKQINTLLIFNENVSEVSPNQRYRVDFTSGQTALAMIIDLPPKFPGPHVRPIIRIESGNPGAILRHPWLDPGGNVVGSPGLNSYGAHSDLGRVVQAIKRTLEREPPVVLASQHVVPPRPTHSHHQPSNAFMPPPTSYPYYPNHPYSQQPQPQGYYQRLPPPAASLPSTPAPTSHRQVLSELEDLEVSELQELKGDQRALRAFLKSLPNPDMDSLDSKIKQERESVSVKLGENKAAVAKVTDKKAELDGLVATHQELCQKVLHLEAKVESARSKNTLASIGGTLKAKAAADEERSEECAEKYLSGDMTTEEFLADYIKLRSDHHRTKAKLDDVLQTNRQLQHYRAGAGDYFHI